MRRPMTTTNQTGDHGDDGIGQPIEQAADRFVEIKHKVAKHLGTRVESLGALIREHPFATAGIGLGIGYLTARLLHR
jgi:ElaB/YqjD/DUF883 family membrane-anchored ribosome-binding protein